MIFTNAKKTDFLIRQLKKFKTLQEYNSPNHNEIEEILYGLNDIQESCKMIYQKLVPRLSDKNLSEEEVEDIIFDIGQEYKHIVYHIQASGYFRLMCGDYLNDD